MSQIRNCLIPRFDGKVLGNGAVGETFYLREDEPHPVRSLLALLQFPQSTFVGLTPGLGGEEAGEVVRVRVCLGSRDGGFRGYLIC